jgi:O-methyltransferase/aklanonic acid methyltransferase
MDFDRVGPSFFSSCGRRLAEFAQLSPGAAVLDVATGRGAVLFPVAEQVGPCGHVVGVDLSAGMAHATADQIRQAGLKQASLAQMDAARLAFADAVFDVVLSGHSIIFFPHVTGEFCRVLRAGGRVGLTIIARGCFNWLLDAFRAHVPPQEAQTDDDRGAQEADVPAIDTPTGMKTLLRDTGFEEIHVNEEEIDFVYADEAEWWSMLWTLGFRSALERMDPAALEGLKADLDCKLQAFKKADGLHVPFRVLYAFGTKSRVDPTLYSRNIH